MYVDGITTGEAEVMLCEGGEVGVLLKVVRLVRMCAHKESVYAITTGGVDEGVDT